MRAHVEAAGTPYDEGRQRQRALDKLDWTQIIETDAQPIGVLKVDRSQQPWHFGQIQLRPEYQGRGWGSALIRCVLEEADEVGAAVELSVLKGNPAKRLYERMGFVVVEEKERAWKMRYG